MAVLANQVMLGAVGAELREKIENPLKFQWADLGAGTPPVTVHGFESSLLIDICNAIIASEKQLGDRYANIARQAHIIVGASAFGLLPLKWIIAASVCVALLSVYRIWSGQISN